MTLFYKIEYVCIESQCCKWLTYLLIVGISLQHLFLVQIQAETSQNILLINNKNTYLLIMST